MRIRERKQGLESGADKETRPITDKKSGGNENTQILRPEWGGTDCGCNGKTAQQSIWGGLDCEDEVQLVDPNWLQHTCRQSSMSVLCRVPLFYYLMVKPHSMKIIYRFSYSQDDIHLPPLSLHCQITKRGGGGGVKSNKYHIFEIWANLHWGDGGRQRNSRGRRLKKSSLWRWFQSSRWVRGRQNELHNAAHFVN